MRALLLAAALAVAPAAYAQMNPGTPAGGPAAGHAGAAPTAMAGGGAENCGTPDEFRPCPPLPRHPLPYFPANRRQ
jgi:hypothetical protein